MAWREKPGNPDIRRDTFPITVQRSGGGTVTENMIIDQNIKTGNYIVYKKNLFGGEEVVIQSNRDANDGLYKIISGPGAQLAPIGVNTRDYERFIIRNLPTIADNQRKNYFQTNGPEIASRLGVPGFRNVANPNLPTGTSQTPYLNQTGGAGGSAPAATPAPTADGVPSYTFNPTTINVGKSGELSQKGEVYRYPSSLGLGNTKQDFIKFDVIDYGGRTINQTSSVGGIKIDTSFGRRNFSESIASVILPIQSGISDENSVTWGGENLDAISAYFAGKSFNAIESGLGKTLDQVFKDVGDILEEKSYENALKVYLAGQAVGTNNLLSRTTGAIVNPNLELLFQGPSLRPFNFNFRLSPRDDTEATQVKKIIRLFKESSAVRNSDAQLFLKAPYVFRIKYVDGSNKNSVHRSLNLIKECALLSCTVNYTPENTYMTFNDPDHTMVSYELSLRFSELEPVTSNDYDSNKGHPIGY